MFIFIREVCIQERYQTPILETVFVALAVCRNIKYTTYVILKYAIIHLSDMYVTPVDDQLSSSCPKTSICDRELPELPPDESRKQSSTLIPELPYDDDDLYDEINPVAKKSFKIPKDLSKLSTNDISEVLRTINMAEHISRFRNEMIDGEIFKALDDKTLDSLGVTDPLQKLRIKKLLKGWRPKK